MTRDQGKVLLYSVTSEKAEIIRKAVRDMGIEVTEVQPVQYRQPIGAVALGISGQNMGTAGQHSSAEQTPFLGEMQVGEMLVMSGIIPEQMDQVLQRIRESGAVVALKAIVTMYNFQWDACRLYRELKAEHESLSLKEMSPDRRVICRKSK